MRVALVFPPLAVATQPYSSLPALSAFIRSRKHHCVSQLDANIEFTRTVLTPRALSAAARRINQALNPARSGNSSGQAVSKLSEARYWQLVTAAMKAPIVVDLISQAVSELKTSEVYQDPARLDRAKRVIRDAFEITDAGWFPVCLSGTDVPHRFTCAELLTWANSREENPVRSFLQKRVIPRLLRSSPDIIGVSISYESQLMAAVTLCRLIKDQVPDIPIVLGGNIVTCWYENLDEMPEVFEVCDYLIPFEGETALDDLLTSLEGKLPLEGVRNLVYRDDGRIVRNPRHCEDIDALPTPDYEGLPLDSYLSPHPVLLINASRGCYWSRCRFCSVSPPMRGSYRERRPDLVMRDIETLQAKHSAHCFMFGDDCVSPRQLHALARGLARFEREISWQCEARFEPALTAELIRDLGQSGCRNLTFGLESHSAHVLSCMDKGIRLRDVDRILDDCRRHHVAFNLQLFFGFPGETEGEACETVDFVLKQMYGAATCSFGVFRLLRGSAIARSPERFGISVKPRPNALCAQLDYEPIASYAREARQRLHQGILTRMRWPHLGFALDAHTLIFLHEAGVSRMAREYYTDEGGRTPDNIVETLGQRETLRLIRKSKQTILALGDYPLHLSPGEVMKRILVYDFEMDRAVELSPLAAWVLRQFEEPTSAADLKQVARQKAGDLAEAATFRESLDSIVGDLCARNLLVQANCEAGKRAFCRHRRSTNDGRRLE